MSDNERFTILVVDDERADIEALSHILKPWYNILVAKDGATAIEYAEKSSPDLILLDIVMPGMSGFDTLVALKGSDVTRGIPVIFITGLNDVEYERKGLVLGAMDYIIKPFHDTIVEARVRNHIQMIEYIRTIERLCMIDALTGIPNRRHFDIRLSTEWDRAIRDQLPISMLMIDMDDFKSYNDAHGHLQGDILLKAVAALFRQELKRPADFAARWGGEEFSVLLPDTDMVGSIEVAESIRSRIENMPAPIAGGENMRITVSIGVDTEVPTIDSAVDSFVDGADQALYLAKEHGKNQVLHIKQTRYANR